MAANEDFFLRLEIWWRFCRWKRFPIQQGHRVGKLRECGARPRNSPKHARKPATISTMRNLRSWSRFVTKICSQTVMSRQNDQKVFFQHKNSAGHAARASNWLNNAVMFNRLPPKLPVAWVSRWLLRAWFSPKLLAQIIPNFVRIIYTWSWIPTVIYVFEWFFGKK